MTADSIPWHFDEVAHAGPEHLDAEYVARYDEKSPTDWNEDVAKLRAMGIGPESTVVDFGAGTGGFAQALAHYVARVVGVDPSEAMVAAMREKGVEAVRAGFLSYEHDGPSPDAVFSRNALHHLPDFWKVAALQRIAQLLEPEGVLLVRDIVCSFEPAEADAAVSSWLASAPDDETKGWTAGQLAEHLREEHSTYSWLLEAMLGRVGFEFRERSLSRTCMYAAYTCVRR